MLYCVFRILKVFFLVLTQFVSRKATQLLKTYEKNLSDFYMKIIINKHMLLYIRQTICSIQQYNSLGELTK